MKRVAIIISLILIFISYRNLNAQDDTLRWKVGGFINFGINSHSADFKAIPDCPNCSPGFETGSGTGLSIGGLFEYPLNYQFDLGIRLSYYNFSAKLTRDENTKIIVNGTLTDGQFEHSIDATLASIGIEPMLKYNPYKDLHINVGFHLGHLMTKSYSQKEQITKPSDVGTFVDSISPGVYVDTYKRTRNEHSGDLPNVASLLFAPFIGASWEFPLNRRETLIAEPEIYYFFGMTNIISDPTVNKWKEGSLRLGVAVKYSPPVKRKVIEKYEKIQLIDTVRLEADNIMENKFVQGYPKTAQKITEDKYVRLTQDYITQHDTLFIPKKYTLTVDINAVGIDAKGNEIPNLKIKIEEFVSSRLQPLLTYIFFTEGSSGIDSRYIKLNPGQTKAFNEDSLFKSSTLESYYHVLNIIGKRLAERPKAKLKIVGCNDGFTTEKNNSALSRARAESVKKYFVDVWNIPENMIAISAVNLPDKASTPISEQDKIEENRRVEISCDDYEIIKPLFVNDTIKVITPTILKLIPKVSSDYTIDQWDINFQAGKYNKTIENMNSNVQNVQINLEKAFYPLIQNHQPFDYSLKVRDSKGHIKVSQAKKIDIDFISVQKKRKEVTEDKEIDNYSLILFDFDKADISGNNKKIIDFIKSRIKPNSEVTINGYTDRTGDPDHNRELSTRRAKSVQNMLNHKGAAINGIGNDELIYNNELPEGRFYCRTINISVVTPIK